MKPILLILIISYFTSINCLVYYVSSNGTGNSCSQQQPCSISGINQFPLATDDIIQFGCGNFTGLDVGIKVERLSVNGASTGCTIFKSANCMILTGRITITNITFLDCVNSSMKKKRRWSTPLMFIGQ